MAAESASTYPLTSTVSSYNSDFERIARKFARMASDERVFSCEFDFATKYCMIQSVGAVDNADE